jgi:hypothetical protein
MGIMDWVGVQLKKPRPKYTDPNLEVQIQAQSEMGRAGYEYTHTHLRA